MTDNLSGHIVIVSPHSDDAVFSLGAAVAHATSAGAVIRVLTVLAGDPASTTPASDWDRRCGFATEGESVGARRLEDRAACGIIGADVDWLPYGYGDYGRRATDDNVWRAVTESCDGADTVLLPGFPLVHPDHVWLTELLLRQGLPSARVGLYVEQPYAFNRRLRMRPALREPLAQMIPDGVEWRGIPVPAGKRVMKWRAVRAYRSQLRPLNLSLERGCRLERMLLYEQRKGGEVIAWLQNGRGSKSAA